MTIRHALLSFGFLGFSLTLVMGCTHTPVATETTQTAPAKPEPKSVTIQAFDQETLYTLLVAELALVREHYELGLANYTKQAKATKDLQVTERATQIARILKKHEESLELAELWHDLDADNNEARLILVSEYIEAKRFMAAFTQAKALLAQGKHAGFEDIAAEAARFQDNSVPRLQEAFTESLEQHSKHPELLIGASILNQATGDLDTALSYAATAQKLVPDSAKARYQHYRVLYELKREEEAIDVYSGLVKLQPENVRVRSRYAHMLIRSDMQAAEEQYQRLHEQAPLDKDIQLNLALLQLELKRYDDAKRHFAALIQQQHHLDIAHYSLGDIAKANGNTTAALSHYRQVSGGPRHVDAIRHTANIIAKDENLDNALDYIEEQRRNVEGKVQAELYLIHADALKIAQRMPEAQALYDQGVRDFPDNINLRYARAMHYTANNDLVTAEVDFKHALELAPDNAIILNALGYSILDTTPRIDEAEAYIRRAYALSPEDAAIVDSMGWLEYKRGNLKQAQHYLEQALSLFQDGEISAHLGEVLWLRSKKRQAKKVWHEGLQRHPDSPPILETIKRLNVKWP